VSAILRKKGKKRSMLLRLSRLGPIILGVLVLFALLMWRSCAPASIGIDRLRVVVTDPSAAELFCACSPDEERHYEALRSSMQKHLQCPVEFDYMKDFTFDSLSNADAERVRSAHLMIGKHAAMEYIARKLVRPAGCIALLSRGDGSRTLSGVWVVRKQDGINNIQDLAGRPISLGMPWHAEKHQAPLDQLRGLGLTPGTTTLRRLCSETLADVAAGTADAAVISDYALPLLSNRSITHGAELEPIGKTEGVPFIAVFASDGLSKKDAAFITRYLIHVVPGDTHLLGALKSSEGFVPPHFKSH
jgi:ABC-type phosphate/phosphonate transport system substrate-binding protein